MKRVAFCLIILNIASILSAQSVLSFGVDGGVDLLMPKSEQVKRPKLEVGGAFDVGYTHYWPTRNNDWGIHTGISVGYANNNTQLDFSQQYTNFDYMGNEMLYTTSGAIYVGIKRAYVGVPIMAAFRHNGFVAQLGVKAQYVFWSQSSQQLRNPIIDAFYVPYEVHVTNEIVTGVVSDADLVEKKQDGGAPAFNILAALRVGYETGFGGTGKIGIMAYIDYNVWNTLSITQINQTLIAVAPITNAAYPVPTVTVNNAFSTFMSGINPLQIGISIYFGIEFEREYNNYRRRPKTYRSNLRYNPFAFRHRSNRYQPYYSRHRR